MRYTIVSNISKLVDFEINFPPSKNGSRQKLTKVKTNMSIRHIFLLSLPWLDGAQEINYIEDVAPDFYQTCPCIESMPGAMPLSERKTSTVDNCWGACFLLDDCFSFSYDVSIFTFLSCRMIRAEVTQQLVSTLPPACRSALVETTGRVVSHAKNVKIQWSFRALLYKLYKLVLCFIFF